MKFIKTGKYRQDTLERLVEINPLEELRGRLKQMNYFLGFVRERIPDVFPKYVNNLLTKYQELLEDERTKANPPDLDELASENPNLKEHLELTRLVVNYIIQILQLPAEDKLEKIKVANRNYFRSWSHHKYYNLQVLTETLDRPDAIALFKRFLTHHTLENRDPDRKTVDNAEIIYEKAIEPKEAPSDWEIIHTMIGEGKYAFRNDTCVFLNAIGDSLLDTELKYYVCCYGDYEKFKNYHDSIVLTMEHTIAQGDPYCSRVLHDTRVDWDLRHPPKSFWDSMKPDNE
ncbi:MAG: L-2-amino-thiazoline-4-carboxylic acid hydrolase [Candidatus Thorarchaeota archaeon]